MKVAERIVVTGASLAGLRAIEELRAEGHEGEIVAVSAENDMPYDRPPLSKQFLKGTLEEDQLSLRRQGFEDLDVDWRLGCRATALDAENRVIELSDGERLEYGGLLIATGSAARSLPGTEGLEGIHVLRSLEDARALRANLVAPSRIVVIGAGFIGMEVAASARELGLDVTVVEALPKPLLRGLGETLGEWVGERFQDHGVSLHCGVGVKGFAGHERVEGIDLADGTRLEADLVLVGIGAAPVCDWLEGSGLKLENGVVCDATGATGLPDVVAAGDVARWYNPRRAEAVRYEHWTSAVEQFFSKQRRSDSTTRLGDSRVIHPGRPEGVGVPP
ncbi:MAG: NAD(P)/FAD-dependent oxidoreductase [Myxococcota bacterium]